MFTDQIVFGVTDYSLVATRIIVTGDIQIY